MDQKPKSKIFKISAVLILILLILSIVYLVFNRINLFKKIKDLETKNQSYLLEFDKLKNITASSTAAFEDLKSTLSKVIEEEGLKNKTLQDKLSSLDKLTKTDPQLLKKYSKVYFLNENYSPRETQVILPEYTLDKKREYRLHVDVIYFLLAMMDDSRREGLDLLIMSAYRSYGTQSELKSQNKTLYGANTANRFVAEQGYSEHQLGTTVDLTTSNIAGASTSFDKTKEFEWLKNNAHKYGFILSYPKGNNYYAYEPWHWRFVGVKLATLLYQDGIYFYNLDQRYIDDHLINMFDR